MVSGLTSLTHVRTSPYYLQSNGKMERWYKSFKSEAWRESQAALEDARAIAERYVGHYNEVRLHSALGFVTPQQKLEGQERENFCQAGPVAG